MRKSTFRYLFAIAFAAVLVQACAKKDTALTARGQAVKSAADKAAAEKAAAEKAAAEKSGVTKLDTAPTRAKDCVNPIKMEATASDLKIESLVTKEAGELSLNKMTTFISVKSATGATRLVHLESSAADTPADLKEATLANKSFVVCHTVPKLDAGKEWSFAIATVPNAINTEDGKTPALRSNAVLFQTDSIALTEKLTAYSGGGNVEDWIKSLPNAKTIVTKSEDGKTAVVKIQFQSTDEKKTFVMDQTYQLEFAKKEVTAATPTPAPTPTPTPEDPAVEQAKHDAGVQ